MNTKGTEHTTVSRAAWIKRPVPTTPTPETTHNEYPKHHKVHFNNSANDFGDCHGLRRSLPLADTQVDTAGNC